MFTRLIALVQLRRATATLLSSADDRLLDDIGLTRSEVEAMHRGVLVAPFATIGRAALAALPSVRAFPVAERV